MRLTTCWGWTSSPVERDNFTHDAPERLILPGMQTLVLGLIVVYAVFFALIYVIVVRRRP